MMASHTLRLTVAAVGMIALSGCTRAALLPVGAAVPADLSAVDQNGAPHRMGDSAGKVTVVYFYPRDATPGCTAEACAFRDVWAQYQSAGIQVFGVSSDDQASKASFAAEHKLPFPILADTDKKWIDAFHVPTWLGMASRVTFLIGRDLKVARVYPDVDPGVHATQVLADALSLR